MLKMYRRINRQVLSFNSFKTILFILIIHIFKQIGRMIKTFLLSFFVALSTLVSAQTPVGMWKNIDDETGEAKANIQVYEENGKLYGKITAFLRKNADPNAICTNCKSGDSRKNQKIMGMVIMRDMQLKDGMYQSGKILDPDKGKEYGCKIWLENGNPNILIVRGSLGPFYRNQKWYRVQ